VVVAAEPEEEEYEEAEELSAGIGLSGVCLKSQVAIS
jgi:hypothetical protein